MVRLWLAALFLALNLTTIAPAMSVKAQEQHDPVIVVGMLDAYWATVFEANGIAYRSPRAEVLSDFTSSPCPVSYNMGPAAYCPSDQTIYVNPYDPMWSYDPAALYVILGHEFGHHVEWLLGFPDEISVESEQRSDCMAGAFVGAATSIGLADTSTFIWSMWISINAGDDFAFGVPEEELVHDIAGHRAEAFNEGFRLGPSACGIGLT